MSSHKVEQITLSEYNKRYGEDVAASLFVMNRTNPRGRIAFNAMGELNQPIPVIIEPTFIPIDLTTAVPRSTLMQSSIFRRMLSEGSLVIVDNESAERVLESNPRAQAEYERIYKTAYGKSSTDLDMDEDADNSTGGNVHSEDTQYSANPYVDSIIHRMLAGDEDNVDQLVSDLLGRIDSLTDADLEAIRSNINVGEIVDVVVEELNSRTAAPAKQAPKKFKK